MSETTDSYREKYPGMVDPKPGGPIEKVVVGLVRAAFGIAIAIGVARYLVYPIDWGFMRDENHEVRFVLQHSFGRDAVQ
jgi:hypothetical protein